MRWFKHLVESGDDPDIDDSVSLFGADGYYVFFRTLEVMSREFDYRKPGKNTFSVEFFRKKFSLSWRKTVKVLSFFNERERIFFSVSNGAKLGEVRLYCPKLKELCDEHTRKVMGKKSGVGQELVRSESRSETETETETDYLKTGRGPDFLKNDGRENEIPDKIKRSLKRINQICKKEKIDFKSSKWVGWWLKQNGHPQAIADSVDGLIERMLDKSQIAVENPWGYADKIMKTKNGNYWEKENSKKAAELKYQSVNCELLDLVSKMKF